jgi:translation initiation factor IF-2
MVTKKTKTQKDKRAPIVAVVGHIDHGKSTLLDYIRKTNIVDGEAGGITQHISAYEARVKGEDGKEHKITFLDTPGHEAFSAMRERGASIADIAILVVSAEDGVKAQTIEAWKSIEASGAKPIVAINKIDKPGADIERAKASLIEAGIYVEGYGGDIPAVAISAKLGTNIPELLHTILLLAELEDLSGNTDEPGTGVVLESFLDSKRGISATLIIEDGYVGPGMFIVAGTALAPTRMMADFAGKPVKIAECPSPVLVVGFDNIPLAGTRFSVFTDKKAAEEAQKQNKENVVAEEDIARAKFGAISIPTLPVILKADVLGRLDAIKKELEKIDQTELMIKIVGASSGNINESDILLASANPDTVIVGLGVKVEGKCRDQIERFKTHVETFDIIYKLTERMAEIVADKKPKIEIEEEVGSVKILKVFSVQKDKQVIGGRVGVGSILNNSIVKIVRRDFELGRGKIIELQSSKIKASEVIEGNDCGLMVESKVEIAPGDILKSFKVTIK